MMIHFQFLVQATLDCRDKRGTLKDLHPDTLNVEKSILIKQNTNMVAVV